MAIRPVTPVCRPDDVEDSGTESPGTVMPSRNSTVLADVVLASFKRPRGWMILLGALLACCAGIVDVVAKRQLGSYVSHVTGTTAAIGQRLEDWHHRDGEFDSFLEMVLLFVSFVFGAMLCGLLVSKNEIRFGKSLYGTALLGNAFLLSLAVVLLSTFPKKGKDRDSDTLTHDLPLYFASMACGLQNGMCTMHFGAVVRTTHVTGLATDMGLTFGRLFAIRLKGCRRKLDSIDLAEIAVDHEKLRVFLSIFLGFLLGAVGGSYLETHMGMAALLVPAGFTGLVGSSYVFFMETIKKHWKHFEMMRLRDEMEEVDACLEHTRETLAALRRQQPDSDDLEDIDNETVLELEEQFHRALDVIHEVEQGVQELLERKQTRMEVAGRASAPR